MATRKQQKPRVYIQNDELPYEMESGAVISDSRRGGYSLSFESKYIDSFQEFDDALDAVEDLMKKRNYYPNIFYVNDHGNVDLLNSRGKILQSWV